MITFTAAEAAAVAEGLPPAEVRPRRIPCTYCEATEGQACVAVGAPCPAHPSRIRNSLRTRLRHVKSPVGAEFSRWDVVDGIGDVIGKVTGPPEGPFRAVYFDTKDGGQFDRELALTTTTRAARAKVSSHARLIEEIRLGTANLQILNLTTGKVT